MNEKKQQEKKADKATSSPYYSLVNRFSSMAIALMLMTHGFNMENTFRIIIIIAGIVLCALSLIFMIFEHKFMKPGDEFTEIISRRAQSICFGQFPMILFIIFLICIICAEVAEVPLNEYITGGTVIGIVSIVFIAHVFLCGLLIYIFLKKAGKESGAQDEN